MLTTSKTFHNYTTLLSFIWKYLNIIEFCFLQEQCYIFWKRILKFFSKHCYSWEWYVWIWIHVKKIANSNLTTQHLRRDFNLFFSNDTQLLFVRQICMNTDSFEKIANNNLTTRHLETDLEKKFSTLIFLLFETPSKYKFIYIIKKIDVLR